MKFIFFCRYLLLFPVRRRRQIIVTTTIKIITRTLATAALAIVTSDEIEVVAPCSVCVK